MTETRSPNSHKSQSSETSSTPLAKQLKYDEDENVSELRKDFSKLAANEQPDKQEHQQQNKVPDKQEHLWQNKVPDKQQKLKETIKESEKYKHFLRPRYKQGQAVSMTKVIYDLPRFIAEPADQGVTRSGKNFQAQSVETPTDYADSTFYIDCDYISTIHIPSNMMNYFKIIEEKKVYGVQKEDHRWIFVPSYCRAKCGLFDWSKNEVGKTSRVIVVRPSQFIDYREQIAKNGICVAVLSLPEEGNGIGYARYWIQKIAEYFKLQWVWMIDDSVLWMREIVPDKEGKDSKESEDNLRFEDVFLKIETLARKQELAAIGPRVHNGKEGQVKEPFMYKPPRGVVLLNVEKIKAKGVHYRPELVILEDMIFGHECEKAELQVCVMNRFVFYDMRWGQTGTSTSLGTPTHHTPQRTPV